MDLMETGFRWGVEARRNEKKPQNVHATRWKKRHGSETSRPMDRNTGMEWTRGRGKDQDRNWSMLRLTWEAGRSHPQAARDLESEKDQTEEEEETGEEKEERQKQPTRSEREDRERWEGEEAKLEVERLKQKGQEPCEEEDQLQQAGKGEQHEEEEQHSQKRKHRNTRTSGSSRNNEHCKGQTKSNSTEKRNYSRGEKCGEETHFKRNISKRYSSRRRSKRTRNHQGQ